jgi:RimJ/RimL family protein N-acetyltransferase
MDSPTLTTERLVLRPATQADVPFVLSLFSRSETNRYSSFGDISTAEEAQRLFDAFLKPGSETHFRLVADLRSSGEAVGTLGLYSYSEANRRAELGYDLLREHWGRGLTTEAVRELLRYAFEELGLNRVEATTDPENAGSVRVLEKTGFTREGLMRQRHHYKGSFHDEAFYGLLASDWLIKRGRP